MAEIPTIDLTGDENDDWMKKSYPEYRSSEKKAHTLAMKLHNAKKAKVKVKRGR